MTQDASSPTPDSTTLVDTATQVGDPQINDLLQRVQELEDWVGFHQGVVPGAQQINAPHPYQQIASATFGGGTERLDTTGMQVVSNSSQSEAIWFVPAFTTTPQAATPYGYFAGLLNTTSGSQESEVVNHAAANAGSAEVGAISNDTGGQTQAFLSVNPFGNTFSSVNLYGSPTGAGEVIFDNVYLHLVAIADTSFTPQNGDIWFSSTTGHIYAYAGGIKVTLA